MNLFFKFFIFILILILVYVFIIEPIFYRLERDNQDKFLEEFFTKDELQPYKKLLEWQDKILEKKTYLVPEISLKISENDQPNLKRYIIPFQFNLINNHLFDEGIDIIFKTLNINDSTPEEFNLKASILEEIEKQLDNKRFEENGDLILGFDFENEKNKLYIDTNDDFITSYEWNSKTKNDLFYREYKFSNDNKIYLDFVNGMPSEIRYTIINLFPYTNINKILYRVKYVKTNNPQENEIDDIIDSIHINLNEFLNINNDIIKKLKSIINNFKKMSLKDKRDDILDNTQNDIHHSHLDKLDGKEISWFSINNYDNKYSLNIYIRDPNKYDKIMRKIQFPLIILNKIYNISL